MLTSTHPHEHGSTRNGLRLRPGMASLPKVLRAQGYRTAAFVGNWTLRDKLSGLAEHFEHYQEVLTRMRWFGLVSGESGASDLNDAALAWVEKQPEPAARRPLLLWVHCVEPHAPYQLHDEHVAALGLAAKKSYSPAERYDTEVAAVDHAVGELLRALKGHGLRENTLVLFASDHGESLGEHNYWGHGRHLYETTLRIPMSITWPGRIPAHTLSAPALIIDLAPTVLGLVGIEPPAEFDGFDWSTVLAGGQPPADRRTLYQAHRGAVLSGHDSELARRSGLLEVAVVENDRKEIFRVPTGHRRLFDLGADPQEVNGLTQARAEPSDQLQQWLRVVYQHLNELDSKPVQPLDEESVEALRSLGYVN
jgi:arylsulfatase A-like enzyme